MSLAAIPVARVRSIPFPSQLVSSDFFFPFPTWRAGRAAGVRQAGAQARIPVAVIREGRGGMGASHTTGGCRVRGASPTTYRQKGFISFLEFD